MFASTADVFSAERSYMMELDTTENFNSQMKVTKTITSKGGVMEFDPGITYQIVRYIIGEFQLQYHRAARVNGINLLSGIFQELKKVIISQIFINIKSQL